MRFPSLVLWPALLTAAVLTVGLDDARAAGRDPVAGLRASINDLFSPPRRARRAKSKTVQPSGGPAARQAAEPKAVASKASRNGRAAERVAPVPAVGDKAGRGERTARPKPEPRPAAPPAPARDARRDIGGASPPPPTKRAFGDPPQTTGTASARAPTEGKEGRETPPRQDGRMAALPPPTKRAYGDQDKPPAAEPEAAAPQPPPPSACQLRFAAGEAHATASIQPRLSAGRCVVDDVVRLEAVLDKDGRRITVAPAALLQCPMAEALVQWLRDDVAAVARELGTALKSVAADTSFECRSRNHVKGAKLSEHGHANAIDLRGMTLTNGTWFHFTDVNADRPARESLRSTACARFTTVLGPGSDGYHETHIHLDLAQRRSGYRICQWDVRDATVAAVPLPPERPSSAPPRLAKSRN